MKQLLSSITLMIAVCFMVTPVSGQSQSDAITITEPVPSVKVKVKQHCVQSLEANISAAVEQSLASMEQSLASLESLSSFTLAMNLDPEPKSEPGTTNSPVPPSYAYEKEKNISRSFKVKSSDKLHIENQFGKVEVQTWNRNEIAVDVKIVTRAETESKAQEILNKINIRVNDDRGSSLISFVTEREPMQIRSSTQKSFEINYLVRMPKGSPLQIHSKYGAVQLPALDGPTDITVRYGRLTTGVLSNRHNKINVEYSSGECLVEYMKAGDLNIKYSALRLEGGQTINAYTAYSNISIGRVEDLAIESRYDPVFRIGSVNQITGRGSYSSFRIDNLRESVGMEVKYCSKFEIGSIAQNFKNVNVTSGYTSVKLGFSDKSAFNFDVSTAYSNLKVNQELVDYSFREVRNTSATYKGKYGNTSPRGSVNVNSRYGNVQFN